MAEKRKLSGIKTDKSGQRNLAGKKPATETRRTISPEKQNQLNEMLSDAAIEGKTKRVERLLKAGAQATATGKNGWTPLMAAAGNGNDETCRLLLGELERLDSDMREDIEKRDDTWGRTALMWAADGGHTEVCMLLLEKGADVNTGDKNAGRTPLMLAAWRGRTGTCRLLLEKGADIEMGNKSGKTALMHAAEFGSTETCRLLLEKGADIMARNDSGWTALTQTMLVGNALGTCKFLMDWLKKNGGDVKKCIEEHYWNGNTSLIYAAGNGNADTCRLLLDRLEELGGNVKKYIETTDDNGTTALMEAASTIFGKNADTCEFLLDRLKGAGGSVRDYLEVANTKGAYKGRTALMWAASSGHDKICRLLLDRLEKEGGDVEKYLEIRDKDGRTALMHAADFNSTDTCIVLLEKGADIGARDNKGKTALDIALEKRNESAALFLRGCTGFGKAFFRSFFPSFSECIKQ
jgi:ankyrin repeat protein